MTWKLLTACVVTLCAGLAVSAETAEDASASVDTKPRRSETLGEYRARMSERQDSLEKLVDAGVRELSEREDAEAASPTSVAAPSGGFADRANDGIQDFLPLFQFAVNAVNTSDDRKSLTVNWNPVRRGRHLLSAQTTVTEPEVSPELSAALIESVRAAETTRIRDGLGDFEDLNTTLTYAYQSDLSICTRPGFTLGRCGWTDVKTGALKRAWGRDPAIYRHLVDEIFSEGLRAATPASNPGFDEYSNYWRGISETLQEEYSESTLTFGELDDAIAEHNAAIEADEKEGALVEATIQASADLLVADEDAYRDYRQRLAEFGLDGVSDMILAQPLISGTAIWRDRDPFIGADEHGASVRIEWGRANLNALIRRYRKAIAADPEASLLESLREANADRGLFSADRFALSVTYKKSSDLDYSYDYVESVTDPGDGSMSSFDRTGTVAVAERKETFGSLLWSHTLKSQEVEVEGLTLYPRFDVSVEYVDVSDDPMRQDRLVGRAIYAYPLTATVSLPLTLSYANKPEFRGQADREFGAHFGLSYKLQRKKR